MSKELYLYSPIYDFAAESIISQMEESKNEDIVMRVNSPGGRVFSGWGIIAKMKEHSENVKIKVDGVAASMAFFMGLFADEVEALDVSKFMAHKADMLIESEKDQKFLDSVNKDLRLKMKSKLDNEKFKEVTGVTIDEMFDNSERKDYWMSAKEAKSIGLVTKINKLSTQSSVAAFNEKFYNIAAETATKPIIMSEEKKTTEKVVDAKAEFESGIQTERARVAAWNVWSEIDPEAVKKGIESGKDITAVESQEFMKKLASAGTLKKIEASSVVLPNTKPADEALPEAKTYKTADGKEITLTAEQVQAGDNERKLAIESAKKGININYESK